MSKKTNKVKPGRGPTKFPGITLAAKQLGVNRMSLFRALTGEWKLPKLLKRYHQLKEGK